jgi:hypothetical protein
MRTRYRLKSSNDKEGNYLLFHKKLSECVGFFREGVKKHVVELDFNQQEEV